MLKLKSWWSSGVRQIVQMGLVQEPEDWVKQPLDTVSNRISVSGRFGGC